MTASSFLICPKFAPMAICPKLAQNLPKIGAKLAQNWPKIGPKLAQNWPKIGPKLAQNLFKWPFAEIQKLLMIYKIRTLETTLLRNLVYL
jgi:hypothetical protein